jgi:enoyl-CoA hydratase
MSLIRVHVRDRVAVVTLDDPKRRNALSLAMAEEMAATLHDLETSPDVAAVVLTGAPPAFSAGADLDDLERADRERLLRIYEGFLAVSRFPLPTIAAVNGPAVGAGLNLALACDVRVASRSARFESRFIDLALHPGGGHTWMLKELLGPQGAAAVVLCGEPLDGEAAVDRGLAWALVEDEVLVDEAVRLAARTGVAPREMVARLKDTLQSVAAVSQHRDAVELELEAQLWSVDQPAFRERIVALKTRLSKKRPD